MKHFFFLIIIFFFSIKANGEITVIELYEDSVDRKILDTLVEDSQNYENLSGNNETVIENEVIDENNSEDENIKNQDDEDINLSDSENLISEEDIDSAKSLWQNVKKKELIFLLDNIVNIKSPILRKEFLSMLDIKNFPPEEISEEDFQNLIIKSLIKYGNREKAYIAIQSISEINNLEHEVFYRKFELDYLLSTFNLSEACDFKNVLQDKKINIENNFLLKIDIFCLFLEEKIDEANLLYSLLVESEVNKDIYFDNLFEALKNENSSKLNINNTNLNKEMIFLYSAMHRVGNISLSDEFLKVDPFNLSMPIILSRATDISLRLEAAHQAYNNGLIGIDSIAALYQTVDFTSKELNDPSIVIPKFDSNAELGMAFFYQLTNIQLLPVSRIEALIDFWKFAEKNNLEMIAYNLSKKILDSIDPNEDITEFGYEIAKTYIYCEDFEKANKWILFSDSFVDKKNESIKLFYNLYSVNESDEFLKILLENLKTFSSSNIEDKSKISSNEILFTIFSILNENEINPFSLEATILDSRTVPSVFITNKIRNSLKNKNQSELLLYLVASLGSKEWNELHPEHLRLILIGLRNYKKGLILNDIILEILKKNKII